MQRIVLTGVLCDSDKDVKVIVDAFADESMTVEYVDQYETLPGQGGEGGRSDLVFDMEDDCVKKAAVHQFHLTGLFRWAGDYYSGNKSIVPVDKRSLFKNGN